MKALVCILRSSFKLASLKHGDFRIIFTQAGLVQHAWFSHAVKAGHFAGELHIVYRQYIPVNSSISSITPGPERFI